MKEIYDKNYKILSKISVSDEENKMSVFSKLFTVWLGGNTEIWSNKGRIAGNLEDFKM